MSPRSSNSEIQFRNFAEALGVVDRQLTDPSGLFFTEKSSFWKDDRELTDNVRLAESQISVNRQVTDKMTELEENFRLRSDFPELKPID